MNTSHTSLPSEWAMEAVCARARDYGLTKAETSLLLGLEVIKATFISVGAEKAEHDDIPTALRLWRMASQAVGAFSHVPTAHHLSNQKLEDLSEKAAALFGRWGRHSEQDFRNPSFHPSKLEKNMVGLIAGIEAIATLDVMTRCLTPDPELPSIIKKLQSFIAQSPQFGNLHTIGQQSFKEAGYLKHANTLLEDFNNPRRMSPLQEQLRAAVGKLNPAIAKFEPPFMDVLVHEAHEALRIIVHSPGIALTHTMASTQRAIDYQNAQLIH